VSDHFYSRFNTHEKLRSAVVNSIAKEAKKTKDEAFLAYKNFQISELRLPGLPDEHAWTRYLNKMKQPGTWADEFVVVKAAKLLGRHIKLLSPAAAIDKPWLDIDCPFEAANERTSITLVYFPNEHFQSIVAL